MELYTLSSKVYYNNYEYIKILVLDRTPNHNDLIINLIKRIIPYKLSEFDIDNNKCIYSILNPNDLTKFLKIEEIPLLFSWLVNNGYTINTNFTKIIQKTNLEIKNNIICFISKI